MNPGQRPAAFLDRDGVINVDHGYVHEWAHFQFLPGAVDAMKRLSAAGYELVVVTNQSGIARGFYTEAGFQELTRRMREALKGHGVQLAGVFHCPHHPRGSVPALSIHCGCRKPLPGLILQAVSALALNPATSIMVGDKMSDMEAARAAGVGRAFLVDVEAAASSSLACVEVDGVFCSLADCVDHVLASPAAHRTSEPRQSGTSSR